MLRSIATPDRPARTDHHQVKPAPPPDFADFKASVLHDATQDWLGVYEVWWEANTRYPSLPLSERLAIAERLVAELIGEGRVRLFRRPWTMGDYELVPDDEASGALADWTSWVPQSDAAPMLWLSGDIGER